LGISAAATMALTSSELKPAMPKLARDPLLLLILARKLCRALLMLRPSLDGPRKHHRRRFAATTWPPSAALAAGRVRLGKRGALSTPIDSACREGHGGDLGFAGR
jgi:hypothetical protein